MMTEQEIERCLERFTIGKATDVMNFDYSGTLAYLQRLKAENAALRERLERSVDKEQIAKFLAGMFGCPCDYFPLDEEMYEYCDECGMDNVVCWEKVIDKKSDRLAEEGKDENY